MKLGPGKSLPIPTYEDKVVIAQADEIVLLWRGCRPQTAERISATKTAGGYDISATPGLNPPAPTEDQARAQVAGMSGHGFQAAHRFPEYTTSQAIARQFSNGAIVCIAIKRKYITKGSTSESGWIAAHEAPIEGAIWQDYTSQSKSGAFSPKIGKDGKPIRLIGD